MEDVSRRQWWIRVGDNTEGPLDEAAFQEKLRAGKIPLGAAIKSNMMESWEPLLAYISSDETFRRPSQIPETKGRGD